MKRNSSVWGVFGKMSLQERKTKTNNPMPGSAAGNNRSGVCNITRVEEASPKRGSPSCSVLRESFEDGGWRVEDGR